ncbi:hypothetical protein M1O29_04070, partial [Dehalococcoidia bacterium]|nr:hypothetical protein [Dehalococcoidia bacterium]
MGNEPKKAIFARAFEQIATRALSGARSLRHLPIKEFSRNPSLFIGNISLASLFAAVLSLLAAGTVRLVASELSTSAFTLLALGLLLLLVAVGTGFDSIRANLMTRKGFYGFNTTAMILIFVAIASIIIFVGTKNNARYDVTAT